MATNTKSTAAARKAAARKAAAARAETSPDPRACTWRGNEFALPPQLPATVGFDMADLENGGDLGALFRFLTGLIGGDQLATVRDQVAKDGDALEDLDDVLLGLLDEIFGAYGVSLGESEASPAS